MQDLLKHQGVQSDGVESYCGPFVAWQKSIVKRNVTRGCNTYESTLDLIF